MADPFKAALWGFVAGWLLLFAFLLCRQANAQDNNLGASYIGMCHRKFPCDDALAVFNGLDVARVGWLAVTFGKTCTCPKRFLALPGRKLVRVHLINGTCFKERGRSCAADEVFYQETIASADKKFKQKNAGIVRRYRRALQATQRVLRGIDADTTLLLSLCLECPLSNRARAVMLTEAQKVFSEGVTWVDSVLSQRCLPGLVCEKHGGAPRVGSPCVVDTDGDSFLSLDVPIFIEAGRACEAALLWAPRFNLLCPDATGFIPPLSRSCIPTKADFKVLRSWLVYSPGL